MTRAVVFGLAMIALAFVGRGYVEAVAAQEEPKTWAEFAQELRATRAAVRAADSVLGQGLDRQAECRYATSDGSYGWSTPEVRRTIACAVLKWPVPGGLTQALSVAACESGADLMHPTEPGGYSGTYQQAERYWPGRQNAYNPAHWDRPIPESSGIPRANVVVSIRMAHRSGWNDWSGCA